MIVYDHRRLSLKQKYLTNTQELGARTKSYIMGTNLTKSFSPEDRDQVRQLALVASDPMTLFWPMRSMVVQNPRHELEYLPFDQAVRKRCLRFLT